MTFEDFWDSQLTQLNHTGISQAEINRTYSIAHKAWYTAILEVTESFCENNDFNLPNEYREGYIDDV